MAADKQYELELWHQHRIGNPQATGTLVKSLDPLIQSQVDRFSNAPLPRHAIEAEARRLTVKSFEDYNPEKAGLSTHVVNHLKHLQRFVADYQNIGRIPENRTIGISKFQNTRSHLEETLGRPASVLELSDELKWSPSEVSRMQQELRRDLSQAPKGEDEEFFDADYNKTNETREIIEFIYWDPITTNEEKKILEFSFGIGGNPKLDVKDIALRLNKSETYIRKLRAKLAEKIQRAYI
jgi:DNA-directed RNA polymerase sigma subunit (sigma70/sigma32)